jgi:hypothetical protein
MKNVKVISVTDGDIEFDNGVSLSSYHENECCEDHYLDFSNITMQDFEGLIFDLSNDDFFERVPDFGIALKPTNGHPVRIPGYGYNNGYYSDNLALVLEGNGVNRIFDITECQVVED